MATPRIKTRTSPAPESAAQAPGPDPAAGAGAVRPLDQAGLTHLVGYAATRASLSLKKCFRQHLGPLRLKAVEFSILVLVDSHDEVNQKQLGQALEVSAPHLAITLDRMVQQGWVRRERSERDRRAQLIRLTAPGQKLVAQARRIARTMEDDALKVLTAAERAILIELLLRIGPGELHATKLGMDG